MSYLRAPISHAWLLFALWACSTAPAARHPAAASSTRYAEARAQFRTRLSKHDAVAGDMPATPVDARVVSYESDGLHLVAWVSRASADASRPAVVFVNGGERVDDRDWAISQPFRDAGFVVMTPMLRGQNGLAGAYSLFYDEVDDVLAAIDVLARTPGIDPRRIYLAGHSAGGTLALLAALASRRVRAVASLSGSPDFAGLMALPGADQVAPFRLDDPAEIRMRSPQEYATSFPCPVRLFWGSEEPGVADDNRGTLERARAAGLDVQGFEVPGGHHTMIAPALTRAIAFFREAR